MLISDIMTTKDDGLIIGDPSEKVRDVAARLAERRIGAIPVLDGDKVVGIFSERDIVYGLAREGDALLDQTLASAMTSDVVTITPDTKILTAISLMTRRRIRHLPVTRDDALVGFVSIGDLVKSRIDMIESEAEAMRDYIQHGG